MSGENIMYLSIYCHHLINIDIVLPFVPHIGTGVLLTWVKMQFDSHLIYFFLSRSISSLNLLPYLNTSNNIYQKLFGLSLLADDGLGFRIWCKQSQSWLVKCSPFLMSYNIQMITHEQFHLKSLCEFGFRDIWVNIR